MKEQMATSWIEVFPNYAIIWLKPKHTGASDPIYVYLEGVEITYTQEFNFSKSSQKVTCFSNQPLEVQVVANTLFI